MKEKTDLFGIWFSPISISIHWDSPDPTSDSDAAASFLFAPEKNHGDSRVPVSGVWDIFSKRLGETDAQHMGGLPDEGGQLMD